ncbi:MAG: ferrous iron transport protein B [Actinobacteria bacterium]|nr:ferrous iron transport protein B [Actinomycetota bacterium]
MARVASGCCSSTHSERRAGELLVCLAGNPNVGKSTLFNRLTNSAVDTANYPGMTVELNSASAVWEGRPIQLVDIPGTYSLDPVSEDQEVARRALLELQPDLTVVVLDATNLARNLYLALELLDLGFPLVLGLNLMDEARRQKLGIDSSRLSEILGVPVVTLVARSGEGVRELIHAAVLQLEASPRVDRDEADQPPHGKSVAQLVRSRSAIHIASVVPLDAAAAIGERYARARAIADTVTEDRQPASDDRMWRAMTSIYTGVPILLGVLGAVFAVLFYLGGWLSNLLTTGWNASFGDWITSGIHAGLGTGVLGSTLLWGLNGGILATLGVAIPYILTFYLILAVLEDSGYMNAAAFLTDRLMHLFGLHGRATIPLIAAAGCNVPAIMGTRVLTSKRERMIACTLVTLTPCSARTAVIIGAVSLYAGWQWALFVFGVVFVVGVLAGVGLNRILPGQPEGLVMEMFPMRQPSLVVTVKKTWKRFSGFLWHAFPIILIGSVVLGGLYETGWIWYLSKPLSPIVVTWLGLPLVTGIALVFAVLRKELALQLLVVLAVAQFGPNAHNLLKFMSVHQIVVYTIVNTIYIPCVATIAMLGRELGWRRAAVISVGTVAMAVVVGGIVSRLLSLT